LKQYFFIIILSFLNWVPAKTQVNTGFFGVGFQQQQFLYKHGSGIFIYLDAPIADNWSVQYSAGMGTADNSGIYTHLPLPVAAAYVGSLVVGDIGWLSLLVCMIPEGISYTVHRTQRVDVRITASPLGLYFWKSDTEWKDPMIPQAGAAILVKRNTGTPIIKLHASIMYQISTQAPGIQLGGAICIPLN
jgi:hypothetical protein